jgi:hypothetical protein
MAPLHAAFDQVFAQLVRNASTNSTQPDSGLPGELPASNQPSQQADPVSVTLPPVAVPDSSSGDVFDVPFGGVLATDEPAPAVWHRACDACFVDGALMPTSESVAVGSVLAIALAANSAIVSDLVKMRAGRGQQRDTIPALRKRITGLSD